MEVANLRCMPRLSLFLVFKSEVVEYFLAFEKIAKRL